MANREMGEIEITLRDGMYVICFDLNAIEAICNRFGIESLDRFGELGDKFKRPSASDLKFLLHIGLQGGGFDLTLDEVGRLVPISKIPEVSNAIGDAFQMATKGLDSAIETKKGEDTIPLSPKESPSENLQPEV